jgi:hypothetical protein
MLNPRLDDLISYRFAPLAGRPQGLPAHGGLIKAEETVRVLPGGYLCARNDRLSRPDAPYIRLALVQEPATIAGALTRMCRVLN